MPSTKKRQPNSRRAVQSPGWLTSDADEMERHRLRGANESFQIEHQTPDDDFFGDCRIHSGDGQTYRVEIRSLAEPVNSCDCPDHRINGLGTCKHIEATLHRLQHKRKRAFHEAAGNGSPYVEVFLDRRDQQIHIGWPRGSQQGSRTRDFLAPFFSDDNILAGNPLDALPAMQRAITVTHAMVRRRIRVSNELNTWIETLNRRAQQLRGRQHFEAEVAAGKASLDLLKHPLYPYSPPLPVRGRLRYSHHVTIQGVYTLGGDAGHDQAECRTLDLPHPGNRGGSVSRTSRRAVLGA